MTDSQSASQTAAAATAGINLTNSIISSVTPGSLLAKLGIETYKWMICERISEDSFSKCMTLATGIAYPNRNGEVIQQQLVKSATSLRETIARAPIGLVLAGSLGRALSQEVETCYLVSTVAALAHCHSTQTISEYLVDILLHGVKGPAYIAAIQRAPVRAVVRKVVDSIFLNIINAGHHGIELPAELVNLCPHSTNSLAFAKIIRHLALQNSGETVIRSGRFIADLTLWCLTHYHGRLIVTVAGHILCSCVLGESDSVLRIIVDKHCRGPDDTAHDGVSPLNVDISTEHGLNKILSAYTFDHREIKPQKIIRQPLYDVAPKNYLPPVFNKQESLEILCVAKRMMKWLLSLKVKRTVMHGNSEINILVDIGYHNQKAEAEHGRPLNTLLPRYPRIMQLDTGGLGTEAAVLIIPPDDDDDHGWAAAPDQPLPITAMGWYFPLIEDLTNRLFIRCTCLECKKEQNIAYCMRGCLRYSGLVQLYVWMAHAICDASGVDSVAGSNNIHDPELAARAVVSLLLCISRNHAIPWQSWFQIVIETAAGLSLKEHLKNPRGEDTVEGSSLLAAQYGSFTLVAAWMDISGTFQPSEILGINTYDAAIKGVSDDMGLVFAERTLDFDHSRQTSAGIELAKQAMAMQLDECKASLVTAMFRTDDVLYRRITTIETSTQLSLIDPATVALALMHSKTPKCKHPPMTNEDTTNCYLVDFEQGLLRLDGLVKSHHAVDTPFVTMIMDTTLKANVLIGRSTYGSVIRDIRQCCLKCALASSISADERRLPVITVSFGQGQALVLASR